MLKDVYGKKALKANKQAQFVLEKISILGEQSTGDMEISYPLFEEFCIKHPALLFPAFQLQLTLQTKIIGRRFWEGLEAKKAAIQKKIQKSRRGGESAAEAEEVNFREVMEYLSSLSEADREQALNEAMEDAVEDIAAGNKDAQKIAKREIDRLSRIAGSSGLDKRQRLRRSQKSEVCKPGGANKYKVMGGGKQGKRHGMSSGASSRRTSLNEGAVVEVRTCRTNYPTEPAAKHAARLEVPWQAEEVAKEKPVYVGERR